MKKEDMIQPKYDMNRQPIKSEDMIQPKYDMNRQPIKSEDMIQPMYINDKITEYNNNIVFNCFEEEEQPGRRSNRRR